jgi:hypothetical protein
VRVALSVFLTGLPKLSLPGILIGTTGLDGRANGEDSDGSLGKYGLIAASAAREGETDALLIPTGAVRGAGTDPSIRLIAPSALEPANGDATRPPNACLHRPPCGCGADAGGAPPVELRLFCPEGVAR